MKVQGFYYARPMPALEIASIVEATKAGPSLAGQSAADRREAS